MLNLFIPIDLRKNWLLYSSALFTWSLVSYLSIIRVAQQAAFWWHGVAFLLFILLFFASIVASKHQPFTIRALLLGSQILLVLGLIYQGNHNLAPILLCLIATQLPANINRSQAMWLLLTINLSFYFILRSTAPQDGIFTVLIYTLLQVFAFAAIEIMQREQQAREQLAAINQELLATRFMLKESSKHQERLRISRDLHDVIGHQLTGLTLNLEVTQHKVAEPFKADIQQCLTQAKQLLQDVRQVVKQMRSAEQLDIGQALTELVKQLPNCQLMIDSAPNINALNLKQQVLFCLQEGISNALRHGHANQFYLHCQRDKNNITIHLTNNGKPYLGEPFGSGLQGMQERLAPYQGKASLINLSSGCELILTMEDSYD
jgi:two-component system, NarL family, sensor histidine kinase DesK